VQAELPGPFSPDHEREVAAYVAGEISAAELYRRTVARAHGSPPGRMMLSAENIGNLPFATRFEPGMLGEKPGHKIP